MLAHKEKANILAIQFATASSSQNYDPKFLARKTVFETQHSNSINFKTCNNKVFNSPITYKEIKKAIHSSKQSTPGQDNISYLIYKHLPKSSMDFLSEFFNFIWQSGTLPSAWKHAIVTPISKPGKDPHQLSSYYPISLTSTMCKIMERIIVNRLTWFCEKYNLFNKFQSGFRKNRSTLDHISHLHQDIIYSLHNKGKALALFFDI